MVEFVRIINANLFVVNREIVPLEKDVSIMLVLFHALATVNAEKIKRVLVELACWDVEAIETVQVIKLVLIINAKIHVSEKEEFVVQMQNVQLKIIKHHVNVQLDLNQIQSQIKDVSEFHLHVVHLKTVEKLSCVWLENVIYHAKVTKYVQLVNDVSTTCVRKFVTQTIIVFLERSVMMVEFVFLVVLQMSIALTLKSVFKQNVNVRKDTLTRHKVALILTNVLTRFVTLQHFVKTFLVHSNAVVHKILSEILMVMAVENQLNAPKTSIVLIISLVKMENVSILAL